MGRRSTKENKNIYQTSREALGYSREAASEKLNISADRIERIENEKCLPHPDERVCKIICVNHHRLFDTPVFCIMHNGFDNTVISWKKLVKNF